MSKKNNTAIKILTFNGTYLPGYKAGGPIRSIANLVENLKSDIEFNILCQDRDFYDNNPYPNVKTDEWNEVNGANVFYHSSKNIKLRNLKRIINSSEHDISYLNGFFSEYTIKYLLLKKMKLIKNKPVIILPRGDLAKGALSLKSSKKTSFIKLVNLVGLYKNLTWQATSDEEFNDIKKLMGQKTPVYKIGNFAPKIRSTNREEESIKVQKQLNIIFISRITKVKNLKFAIEQSMKLDGLVNFDIYGPISDELYWEDCLSLIEKAPENISINYKGSIENEKVVEALKKADIMFLPTLGENFGHVIVESFLAGTPVLISDQTPWRDLESYGVGWDLPLNKPELYLEKLHYLMDMDNNQYENQFSSIYEYIQNEIGQNDKSEKFKSMVKEQL